MKTFCANLLSLLLLTAQFVSATPTRCATEAAVGPTAITKRACCQTVQITCRAACCVVRDTAPRQASAPTIPSPSAPRARHWTAALLTVLWTLPTPPAAASNSATSSSDVASAPAVPLFLRHGALLI